MSKGPCEYCQGSVIPGIHLPSDFDDREASRDGKVFVARCDSCSTYASDTDAAEAVAKLTGWSVMRSYDRDDEFDLKGRAEKQGTDYYRPYFNVGLTQAAAVHGN